MSNSALNEDFTKKTTDLLSRIVKKTPLNAKLLGKPPFRYLHDLFSEIIGVSGAFDGLYSDSEMNSENCKEKEAKIAYLTKMIDCVKLSTGVELKVNPMKIVAGLEPQETNVLLQVIGKIVLKKVDTSKAVSTITGNPVAPKHIPQQEEPKEEPIPKSPLPPSTKEPIRQEPLKHTPATPKAEMKKTRSFTELNQEPELRKQKSNSNLASETESERGHRSKPPTGQAREQEGNETDAENDDPQNIEQASRMVPAMAKRRERPMSARPPPPKLKTADSTEDEMNRLAVPIQTELDVKNDDDDDFMVQTVEKVEAKTEGKVSFDANEQHGGLVQKILQSKRELEGKPTNEGETSSAESKAVPMGLKEIAQLRNSIQLLCQSTNPLGKTMDYLQEDIDAMNKEYNVWKRESASYKKQLEDQKKYWVKKINSRSISEVLLPQQNKLKQIEDGIQEQLQRIAFLKRDIRLNDLATEKLLRGMLGSY